METETFRDTRGELTQWAITFFGDYFSCFESYQSAKEFLFTTKSTKNWFFSPIGKTQFESIVTTVHMALIIYIATHLQNVFVTTEMRHFFVSEVNQLISDPRYTKETTNYFDLCAIIGYAGIFVLRILVITGLVACEDTDDFQCIDTNYNALYLLVWLVTIASMCFRFCWMLFAFATMGLLVSSMISMVNDIINFMIFVGIFVIGFATIFCMGTGMIFK